MKTKNLNAVIDENTKKYIEVFNTYIKKYIKKHYEKPKVYLNGKATSLFHYKSYANAAAMLLYEELVKQKNRDPLDVIREHLDWIIDKLCCVSGDEAVHFLSISYDVVMDIYDQAITFTEYSDFGRTPVFFKNDVLYRW